MFMLQLGLLILRLAVGLTIAAHGAQKLFGWWEGPRITGFSGALDKMGVRPARAFAIMSALAEFGGGLLIVLGFLNPIGPLVVVGNMLVAIATVHWAKGFFSQKGGFEFPLLLAGAALALSITGPGAYSIDALLGLRLPEPATWIVVAIVALLAAGLALFQRRVALRRLSPC
jgi:putative oxidoreductase